MMKVRLTIDIIDGTRAAPAVDGHGPLVGKGRIGLFVGRDQRLNGTDLTEDKLRIV